jgi:hypothetical protein
MSTIALFLAMGGVSYAAIVITGANVRNGSLTGADLRDGSVAGSDVANNSLGLTELTSGAREAVTMDDESVAWSRLSSVPTGFADGIDNDTDTDTDTNTTYDAGAGLNLTGTTFAADTSYIQRRISTSCAVGSSIRSVALDGTVTCETDDDTTLSPGFGLGLVSGVLSVDQSQVTTDAEQIAWSRLTAMPGGFSDGFDNDTVYNAGNGLTLTGTTFAANTGVIQARVSQACVAGQSIRAIAADGTVSCEADDTGTTYSAGQGLTLSGSVFAPDWNVTQQRVGGSCPAEQSIRAIAADGTIACELDSNTTYAAGTGMKLTGGAFEADTSYLQRRVSGSCDRGISSIDAAGAVSCATRQYQLYGLGFVSFTGTGGTQVVGESPINPPRSTTFEAIGYLTFRKQGANTVPEHVSCQVLIDGTTNGLAAEQFETFDPWSDASTRYRSLTCEGWIPVDAGPHTIALKVTAPSDGSVILYSGSVRVTEV